MTTEDKLYAVGIDLGTTNSAVSYARLDPDTGLQPPIKRFDIPQLTGSGEFSKMPVLPSFLYLPGDYEISEEAIAHPWRMPDKRFAGSFARDFGSSIPGRLVSSAKSWLCEKNVDRRAAILPWGAPEEVGKMSPVEASAAYLRHIKNAWNRTKGEGEEQYLEHQLVVVTVPASFDEAARDLTLEAAAQAGLNDIILLEEPLAAFYSWLTAHKTDWSDLVAPGELILVCDVGGGTTDLTLISLSDESGSPRFERIAVGDHLILGGDNIDLALARHIEHQFNNTQPLSNERWKTLCHLCRQAKENILNQGTNDETITMMGEGTSLIAGTLTAKLDREALEQIVLDGFLALVKPADGPGQPPKKGISEFGLPYESEPAITRHIGRFLEKHGEDIRNFLGDKPSLPDLILFNGGTLKSSLVRERIREAICYWFGQKEGNHQPRVLENPNPDLSVALGASYYGLVKSGVGVRVGSGSPRSYYLGFTRKRGEGGEEKSAICLVERGVDEGTTISLPEERKFEVLTNQPVSFELYSSSFRSGDRCGDVLSIDDTLTPLPPLQTVIQFGQKGKKKTLPVAIEAEYTEMGVLSLWCRSLSSNHRWRLQFQLRDTEATQTVGETEVFEAERVDQAIHAVHRAFAKDAATAEVSGVMKTIAKIVGRPKEKWPLGFIRQLADRALGLAEARKSSPEHEIRWLNLIGFCMRPGLGDGMDGQRMKSLWKLYKPGVIFKKNAQAKAEWWIMWRRVAAGLNSGQQRQIFQDIRPLLLPKKNTKVRLEPQERLELWMAAANLERLMVKDKIELGRQLFAELHPKKTKLQFFWALSRIGAREMLYGPVDRVIPPDEVAGWIKKLLQKEWKNPKPFGSALSLMARKTGDRARDIPSDLEEQVADYLRRHEMTDNIEPITRVISFEKQDETEIFGESLPIGIVLQE